jgi:ABC-type multidrug transport system ATPase subunit
VVLLDEPTRSLDPASALQFWELVRSLPERGATVLLATHSFNEAVAVGDFVAILQEGRLVAHRNLAGVGVDELRDFYFDGASSADDVLCMAGGCH